MYHAQELKERQLPAIDDAIKFLKKADSPDPKQRDVRPLMLALVKMSESIPRLRGHVLRRRTAISAFGWKLEPYDPSDAERMQQARRRLRRVIAQVLKWHTDVPMFGSQAIELNWVTGGVAGTTPVVLNRYHPTEVEPNGHDPKNMSILLDNNGNQIRVPLAQEDPARWLLSVDESWLVGGTLRSLLFPEILLNMDLQEWHWFNQKLKGLIQGRIDQWASDEDKTVAHSALQRLASNNFSLTSDAVEYVFTKITDGAGSQSFEAFKKELENDRAIAILGQANTSELPDGGGSRAALQILHLISADIHYADMIRVEDLINDQLLLADAQLNLNATLDEAPWRFRIDLNEEEDREQRARIIVDYIGAGIPVRSDDVYQQAGLTAPADGDDTIEPRQQAGF